MIIFCLGCNLHPVRDDAQGRVQSQVQLRRESLPIRQRKSEFVSHFLTICEMDVFLRKVTTWVRAESWNSAVFSFNLFSTFQIFLYLSYKRFVDLSKFNWLLISYFNGKHSLDRISLDLFTWSKVSVKFGVWSKLFFSLDQISLDLFTWSKVLIMEFWAFKTFDQVPKSVGSFLALDRKF